MTTLAATISSTGIAAPDYADILQELKIAYWSIYGSDADLDPDSQDGQLLAVFAQAVYDSNQVAVQVYNSYAPSTAQGANLSSVVKINGLQRESASNSTATVTVTGVAGTTINNGIVGDDQGLGTQWALPSVVNIPSGGTVDVTATCTTPGAVAALASTLVVILTPTSGWRSVSNSAAATLGAAAETDAALRERQSDSTAVSAKTIDESIYAAIANLPGVTGVNYDDNDTGSTDGNGVPAHSVAFVVTGGDVDSIAQAIASIKSPGTGTYGTTNIVVVDSHGISNTINFFETTQVTITVDVTIQPLTGYTSAVGSQIVAAVAAYINSLAIGETSYLQRLIGAASLGGVGSGATFYIPIGDLKQSRPSDAPPAVQDVPIAFNEQAITSSATINLTVL
jgi:uncharacterized phage protein gp47/JayE